MNPKRIELQASAYIILRMAFVRIILLLFWGAVVSAHAEFREFTNDFGDTVEAELVELKEGDTIVTLRLKSGRKIDALVTAFSLEDRKYIREWWAGVVADRQILSEDSRITIGAKMNRKSKGNKYNNWYSRVDDETKSFFPEIIVENDDLETYTGNTVRVVIIAEDKRTEGQKLIVSASTLEADFPSRGKTYLEGEPFRLRLFEYDRSYSNQDYEYGYEYEGYVVIVKNSKGYITHQRASKSKYLSNMKVIFECKAGEMYDEAINYKLNVTPNSYFIQ